MLPGKVPAYGRQFCGGSGLVSATQHFVGQFFVDVWRYQFANGKRSRMCPVLWQVAFLYEISRGIRSVSRA
jgi:hypothetical protein